MSGKRFCISVVATVLMFALSVVCTARPVAAEEILKVGIIAPMSGPAASFGLPLLQAGEMWKDRLKAEGGLKVAGLT